MTEDVSNVTAISFDFWPATEEALRISRERRQVIILSLVLFGSAHAVDICTDRRHEHAPCASSTIILKKFFFLFLPSNKIYSFVCRTRASLYRRDMAAGWMDGNGTGIGFDV